MYLNTAQEFIEPRANAHAIPGLHQAFSVMGQFNIKNVTFTLQVMKSQENILFPSKYLFPVSIFYC